MRITQTVRRLSPRPAAARRWATARRATAVGLWLAFLGALLNVCPAMQGQVPAHSVAASGMTHGMPVSEHVDGHHATPTCPSHSDHRSDHQQGPCCGSCVVAVALCGTPTSLEVRSPVSLSAALLPPAPVRVVAIVPPVGARVDIAQGTPPPPLDVLTRKHSLLI